MADENEPPPVTTALGAQPIWQDLPLVENDPEAEVSCSGARRHCSLRKRRFATRLGPMIPLRAVHVGLARASSEWYAYPSDIQAIARHLDAHDELREASVEAAGS
jgi:hypothetical protein